MYRYQTKYDGGDELNAVVSENMGLKIDIFTQIKEM